MILKFGLNVCSGLDTLAIAKRSAAKVDGVFKVPKEGVASVVASLVEEEKSTVSDIDEDGTVVDKRDQRRPGRRYRDAAGVSEASQPGSPFIGFFLYFVLSSCNFYCLKDVYYV